MVQINMMKFVILAVFVTLAAVLVNAYPQLQFEDQRESPDEDSLTRTRRGSQQPEGSYGHHQQTYHPTSYGHGHSSSHGFTGHGHGHGHSSGYGHGHGHGGSAGHQAVGPVFTFVRTDYNGNFQWGVRHKAGGGGHGWGQGR